MGGIPRIKLIGVLFLANIVYSAVIRDQVPDESRRVKQISKRGLPTLGMTCKGRRQATKFYADVRANCEFFYVCDYDNLMHFIQCPPGTIFSEDLQICNFPSYVACTSEIIDNEPTDYGRKINVRSDIPRASEIPVLNSSRPYISRIPSINRLTPQIDSPFISRPVGRRFPVREPSTASATSNVRPPVFGRRNKPTINKNVNNPGIIHSFGSRQYGFQNNPNARRSFGGNGGSAGEQPHLKPAPEPAPEPTTRREASYEPEPSSTARLSTATPELPSTIRIRYYTRSPPTRAPVDYPPVRTELKPEIDHPMPDSPAMPKSTTVPASDSSSRQDSKSLIQNGSSSDVQVERDGVVEQRFPGSLDEALDPIPEGRSDKAVGGIEVSKVPRIPESALTAALKDESPEIDSKIPGDRAESDKIPNADRAGYHPQGQEPGPETLIDQLEAQESVGVLSATLRPDTKLQDSEDKASAPEKQSTAVVEDHSKITATTQPTTIVSESSTSATLALRENPSTVEEILTTPSDNPHREEASSTAAPAEAVDQEVSRSISDVGSKKAREESSQDSSSSESERKEGHDSPMQDDVVDSDIPELPEVADLPPADAPGETGLVSADPDIPIEVLQGEESPDDTLIPEDGVYANEQGLVAEEPEEIEEIIDAQYDA